MVEANVTAQYLPPKLFSKVEATASKSRHFYKKDVEFISSQVNELLNEDIMKESKSSLGAQIVVVRDDKGKHKKNVF